MPGGTRRPGERIDLTNCGLRVVDDVAQHVSAASQFLEASARAGLDVMSDHR